MSEDNKEEVLEKLEAAVTASDADFEDLGIVNKSEYEETQDEIESLREENSDLEEENESLQEEIETVKEAYSESLADHTGFDEETLMEKFSVDELRDLHDEKVEEGSVASPAVKSGDAPNGSGEDTPGLDEKLEEVNEKFFSDDLQKYSRTSEIESPEELLEIVETIEGRGGIWASAAEPYREAYEELTAD